jgi:hypothetical protein
MQPQEFYTPTTRRIRGTEERVCDLLSKPWLIVLVRRATA